MNRRRVVGASYVEVLVAMTILAIALAPAIEALRTGLVGAEVHENRTELHYRLTGRLEELLAEPLAELDDEAQAIGDPKVASTLYSDPSATPSRRLVYLSRYDADDLAPSDGDPFTGMDEGLIWVRVEIENTHLSLEGLVSEGD